MCWGRGGGGRWSSCQDLLHRNETSNHILLNFLDLIRCGTKYSSFFTQQEHRWTQVKVGNRIFHLFFFVSTIDSLNIRLRCRQHLQTNVFSFSSMLCYIWIALCVGPAGPSQGLLFDVSGMQDGAARRAECVVSSQPATKNQDRVSYLVFPISGLALLNFFTTFRNFIGQTVIKSTQCPFYFPYLLHINI